MLNLYIVKIKTEEELLKKVSELRRAKKKIVFTNGCFDLIHLGHIHLLRTCKGLGDILIVAINSDRSVKENKGEPRPLVGQKERAEILAAFQSVDYVTVFDDPTPLRLIERVRPDVLVKGADWEVDGIVGREPVTQAGGQVVAIPLVEGFSTTKLIEKITRSEKVKKSRIRRAKNRGCTDST